MSNVQCKKLKSTCSKCGWKNTTPRVEICQECGQSLRCTRWAVSGYTLCTSHGGPVPSRNFFGSGTIKTGARDSMPLMRLAARYNKMQENGQLLSNRAAVDIIDVRIRQLAERIDENDTPERMKALYSMWGKYMQAVKGGDEINKIMLMGKISEEFDKVYHDYESWSQMLEVLEYRRKMTETEVKILKEIKAVITVEDMYDILAKVLAVLLRMFKGDPKKLKEVKYEFAKITGERIDVSGEPLDEYDRGGGGEVGSPEGFGEVDSQQLLHSGDEERSEVEGEDRP